MRHAQALRCDTRGPAGQRFGLRDSLQVALRPSPVSERAWACPAPGGVRGPDQAYMPGLLGLYENACELIGDDALSAQIISQYRPPPLLPGCTQAVWRGSDGPALVRNYDFSEIRLLRRTVASNPMCG